MKTSIKHLLVHSLCTALLLLSGTVRAETEILDQVVAIVDDDVILATEVDRRYQQAVANINEAQQQAPEPEALRRDVLDRLIIESIQLQMAERAGVRISDEQLNEAVTRIAQQNNLDLDSFRKAIEADGMSYTAMREQVRQELLLQRVQAGNVNQRVQISDQEIDNFLASEEGQEMTAPQFHFAHYLISMKSAADSDTARAFATDVAARLQKGEPVKPEASDPLPLQVGDLGWRNPAQMPSLFVDIAGAMAVGEVSAPIQTDSGIHLIKLLEARGHTEIIPQTRARHILLKTSAIRTDEQTETLANQLRERVAKGAVFADLAREFSEDIGSAMEGGDLGWISPDQMVTEFEQAMDNTAVGAISAPFNSRYGWHIVQVEDRRQQDVTDDMRRNLARNIIHQRKFDEELEVWQQKIRDEAYVDLKR